MGASESPTPLAERQEFFSVRIDDGPDRFLVVAPTMLGALKYATRHSRPRRIEIEHLLDLNDPPLSEILLGGAR